jgi:quercetin dioxygenase-like cupin family protein
MKKLLILAALIALAGSALAQNAVTAIKPDALKWADVPTLPKGAQIATLMGDPTKAGEAVVQRLKFPANYQAPLHTHPYVEIITVISGSVGFGNDEKLEKKGEMLKPGAFLANPAKLAHYAWTGNEGTIIQIQYIGPRGIDFVNPADDPRKKSN